MAWLFAPSLQIEDLKDNRFLFLFESSDEQESALSRGPWNVRRNLLVLKPWPPGSAWQEVDLSTTSIWVQLHGIPLSLSTPATIRTMGALIGRISECDFPED